MNKDVIYIDTEDDITTIIGKIKSSKERIIALVPPRRVGVLQSAVNIRLLARAAKSADKRIVIITGDSVLSGLAATAKIPVAKTLQSKPEIAEIPALKVDEDNDVIDGGSLPIGDMADSADKSKKASDAAVDKVIAANDDRSKAANLAPKNKAKMPKVPNFNVFRKKFVLIGGGALLFIVFMVWAIWFAPSATVIISAKTTSTTVSETVALTTSAETDPKANTIKAISKEAAKEIAVEFAATGKKNVGEKATGTVRLSNPTRSSVTISAGTILKNNGLSYVLSSSVTVPGATLSWDCSGNACAGTKDATITAVEAGSRYNAASGSMSIAVDKISASLRSPTSGGTDKTATVVTSSDLENAKIKLSEQKVSGLKEELTGAFGSSAKIVSDSYTEKRSDPTSSVLVDAEANGNVTLKAMVTASMLAVEQSDLQNFVETKIKDELSGKESQKIYDNGVGGVVFSQFSGANNRVNVKLVANGKVGPEIDEDKVKDQAKGRSYGEIQSSIESISGVEDVDIKFSPFWVKSAPNDVKKIKVEFKLEDAS